jgi:hypothetical protein
VSRYRHAGDSEERRYSFYSFFTSTLDGGEWSASLSLRALLPRRTAGTLFIGGWVAWRLVWTHRMEEKPFSSAGDRISVIQSGVRQYTDWAYPIFRVMTIRRIPNAHGKRITTTTTGSKLWTALMVYVPEKYRSCQNHCWLCRVAG